MIAGIADRVGRDVAPALAERTSPAGRQVQGPEPMKEREVKLGAPQGFQLPDLERLRDGVVLVPRKEQRWETKEGAVTDKRQKRAAEFIELFRVNPGSKVTLGKDFDPAFKAGVKKKGVAGRAARHDHPRGSRVAADEVGKPDAARGR